MQKGDWTILPILDRVTVSTQTQLASIINKSYKEDLNMAQSRAVVAAASAPSLQQLRFYMDTTGPSWVNPFWTPV